MAFDLEVDQPVFGKRASLEGVVRVPRLCLPYQEPGGKSNIVVYTQHTGGSMVVINGY